MQFATGHPNLLEFLNLDIWVASHEMAPHEGAEMMGYKPEDFQQLTLCLSLNSPLQRLPILPQINALLLLEIIGQVVDNALVKVITTKLQQSLTKLRLVSYHINNIPHTQPYSGVMHASINQLRSPSTSRSMSRG